MPQVRLITIYVKDERLYFQLVADAHRLRQKLSPYVLDILMGALTGRPVCRFCNKPVINGYNEVI